MSDDPRPHPDDLEPVEPEEAGVPEKDPPQMQVEPARLLANDARDELRAQGFHDHQIDAWAETFIAERRSGDVREFIAWIAEQQRD